MFEAAERSAITVPRYSGTCSRVKLAVEEFMSPTKTWFRKVIAREIDRSGNPVTPIVVNPTTNIDSAVAPFLPRRRITLPLIRLPKVDNRPITINREEAISLLNPKFCRQKDAKNTA